MKRQHRKDKRRSQPRKPRKFFNKEEIFLSRMASILKRSKMETRKLFSYRTVSTIRLNPLAAKPEIIKEKLESKGLDLKEVPWAPNTYIVKNYDKSDLAGFEEYKKGLFYIQNLSSILPVVLMDPQKGSTILDACAAPGSKTTLIAAMMENEGEITANEDDFSRMKTLNEILELFHVTNTKVEKGDAIHIGKKYEGRFDQALLDAPCSGEGLIYMRGGKPLRFWNIKKIKALAKLQKKMILSVYDSLKPGGMMIYSTCTLEPDENEGVLTYLLEMRNAEILPITETRAPEFQKDYSNIASGITKWSGNKYHHSVANAIRIIPSTKMQGFFIAKIKKPVEVV